MKKKTTKISFLSHKKTIHDKFFDLVKINIKSQPNKKGKWVKRGVKDLADELEISTSKLNSIIKKGFINENDDELWINIERNFNKLKRHQKKSTKTQTVNLTFDEWDSPDNDNVISSFKKITKQFSIHTFTFSNFFKMKPFGKLKKNEQLYFKAGLYIVFRAGKKGTYTIQNLPISHYANKYPQGYKEFFDIIKIKLIEYPSMLFFRFNYFDVEKINVGSIEERISKFQNKNAKNNKRKK